MAVVVTGEVNGLVRSSSSVGDEARHAVFLRRSSEHRRLVVELADVERVLQRDTADMMHRPSVEDVIPAWRAFTRRRGVDTR